MADAVAPSSGLGQAFGGTAPIVHPAAYGDESSSGGALAPVSHATSSNLPKLDKPDAPFLQHSLRRNQACLSCRKRKLKCDAVRPVCGTCARSREAAALSRYISPVPDGDCVYPDPDPTRQEGVDDSVPPAFRSSDAKQTRRASSDEDTSPTQRKRARNNNSHARTEEMLACVQRLEALLAESRKTIREQAEAAQRAGISLVTPTSTEPASDLAGSETSNPIPPSNTWSNNSNFDRRRSHMSQSLETDMVQTFRRPATEHNQANPFNWTSSDSDRVRPFLNQPPLITAGAMQTSEPDTSLISGSALEMGGFQTDLVEAGGNDLKMLTSAMMSPWPFPSPSPSLGPILPSLPLPDLPPPPRSPGTNLLTADQVPDPFMSVFWPDWPTEFPSPVTLFALVDTFFALDPISVMIPAEDFKRRLQLPYKFQHFPDKGLIHTILAAAAPLSDLFRPEREPPGVAVGDRITPLETDSSPKTEPAFLLGIGSLNPNDSSATRGSCLAFSEYHLNKAQAHISRELTTPSTTKRPNPMEWLQALLILSDLLCRRARAIECFLLCGMLCKALAPFGLTKLPSYDPNTQAAPGCFLPPPESTMDAAVRRITFWCAYMNEAWYSNTSYFWASAIDDKVVTTAIPSLSYEDDGGTEQTLATPDEELFGSGHTDDFTLHVKAIVLFKRVRALISAATPHTKQPVEFAERTGALDQAILLFLSTCPRPTDARNFDLLCARLVALAALTILHEPFVNFAEPRFYSTIQVNFVISEAMELVDLIRFSKVEPGHLPARTLATFAVRALFSTVLVLPSLEAGMSVRYVQNAKR